jgi:tetratricopeptide (TPR) repeat protein
VLLSSLIYSQNFLTVDKLDKKLIDMTFNDEFVEVKQICDSLSQLDKRNPKYYFHYFGADALQLHGKINSSPLKGRDSVREVLVDKSLEKLEKAIQILDNIPETPLNRFYIASLHGYYSRYAGLNRYWWAAYINGTKANGMFEDLIEEFPDCYDAYLYPGVFGYYADRLSGFNGFIAGILGVSGDRKVGLEYIKIALKKGKTVYPQALLMMIEINTVMEDNPYKAIPYFEEFLNAYPKNKRVINWYGHTLLNLNSATKISEVIKNDSFKIVDKFVKTKYYFLIDEVDSATKYSKSAFENPNTWKGIIEHTKYYCVYANWLNKNPKAIETYKSKLDEYYSLLFEMDLNNVVESKYIYRLSSYLARHDFSNFNSLSKEQPIFKEKYFEAEFNLLQGILLFETGELLKSIPFFEKAEITSDWRKNTIALRYQLDIYLQKEIPIEKVNRLIEKIEIADYSKLTFRLDDLKQKYKLNF